MHGTHLLANRSDLRETRWASEALPDMHTLDDTAVLLRVDEFALTANNITYAVAGDSMGYWQFFPAPDGWGRVPVWGFATVVASNCNAINEGERLYGYLPMGSHLLISAGRIKNHQVTDVSAHRSELPHVYNQFVRTDTNANGHSDPEADAAQMLFRPLFMTSFILDSFISSSDYFGASDVILTSASSKTSLGLAVLLARRKNVRVIGLTGPSNVAFVNGLGCYDLVTTYDEIASLDNTRATMSVDMAGNGRVLTELHNRFADKLKYSCLVGATHWDQRSGNTDMAGPKPEGFFAPAHIQNTEWGPGGLEGRFSEAWDTLIDQVRGKIRVQRARDLDEIETIYQSQLAGRAGPDIGYVLTIPVAQELRSDGQHD